MVFKFPASWAKDKCKYTIQSVNNNEATILQEFVDIDDNELIKFTYSYPINCSRGIEYIQTDSHILKADCSEGSFVECIPL